MGKNIVCTFSGARYHDTTKRIVEDSPRFGADQVLVYDDHWLVKCSPKFVKSVQWAFDHPKTRGFGWFTWKPYVIIDALSRCEPDDVVLFVDADTWPIADMTPLFDEARRENVMLFAACGHLQRHWSKRDAQLLMDADSDYWRDKQAGVARFMLFKKVANGEVLNGKLNVPVFLHCWFGYTCDQRLNTFDKSVLADEYPDLKEHRCEQAILTQMAHRLSIPLHREADQWGNPFRGDFPLDQYPQIFESTGVYSYDPDGHRDGSKFLNVE